MSVNASSTANSSRVLPHPPHCYNSVTFSISFTFSIFRFVLLVPLSIFILYLAYQQWQRQQRSFKASSHCDIFTYHVTILELIWGLGTVLAAFGVYYGLHKMMLLGFFLNSLTYSVETSFHILTCVERYLAVVHPITYLGLRNSLGVRIRNISVGCAWLLSVVWSYVASTDYPDSFIIPCFCVLLPSLALVSFCSLCVLRVLIRPGPGEGGGDREHVDQSKQRALFTIMAILGVLLLWFLGLLLAVTLYKSPLLNEDVICALWSSAYWLSIPSSLVLPLLYLHNLHRTGKLSCCC